MILPNRLYVIAAHPDDDTIGCGGLMAMVARAAGAVTVAYLTDGSRSHPASARFSGRAIAALRENEARAALAELGILGSPRFHRALDSALGLLEPSDTARLVDRLAVDIRAFGPDAVVAPWRRDPHADHVAASSIARASFARAESRGIYAEYDVWLSIRGSAADAPQPGEATIETIPIDDDARAAKRRALGAHRSQVTDLIDDDPGGFRITPELAERWLGPSERFFLMPPGTLSAC